MKRRLTVVLALCDYYRPGHRAGGPIRTLEGIADRLSDEFALKIITRDRDLGDRQPYPDVTPQTWRDVGAASVMYLSPKEMNATTLRRLIATTAHDILYLNSWFSVPFAITPLALRRIRRGPQSPVVIAPRGEFAASALGLHPGRKRLYLQLAR